MNDNNPVVPIAAAGAGVATGYTMVVASGMTAAGMVGGGAGIGIAAGPVGVVVGGLTGLAAYGLFRFFGGLADTGETEEARTQAAVWAWEWATTTIERTNDPANRLWNAEATASFDKWLEERFDGYRPWGWRIWTSRVAAMRQLGFDPSAPAAIGVRLRSAA